MLCMVRAQLWVAWSISTRVLLNAGLIGRAVESSCVLGLLLDERADHGTSDRPGISMRHHAADAVINRPCLDRAFKRVLIRVAS